MIKNRKLFIILVLSGYLLGRVIYFRWDQLKHLFNGGSIPADENLWTYLNINFNVGISIFCVIMFIIGYTQKRKIDKIIKQKD